MDRIMTFNITLYNWNIQKDAARSVREQVFVIEQQIPPEMEMDKSDAFCIHAVAADAAGTPVGTGRLLPDSLIRRMAGLARAWKRGWQKLPYNSLSLIFRIFR
jgi:hypothetical protein